MQLTYLTDVELEELDQFLLYGGVPDDSMILTTVDGYFTAIATGIKTIMPREWLPAVWGKHGDMIAPKFESLEHANRIFELMCRHMNGINALQQAHDGEINPIFEYQQYPDDPHEYTDAEMWAHGFVQGMRLDWDSWKVVLDDTNGKQWLRPILLLGKEDATPEEEALVRWPNQREELGEQISFAVQQIYRFLLPYRRAWVEQSIAKSALKTTPKIGRNDPCPCGSGKKFKKCCGAAINLH